VRKGRVALQAPEQHVQRPGGGTGGHSQAGASV
jgi:hypothetical protein